MNTATSCARDLGSTNDVWIGGGLGRARNESGFSAGGLLNGANLGNEFTGCWISRALCFACILLCEPCLTST